MRPRLVKGFWVAGAISIALLMLVSTVEWEWSSHARRPPVGPGDPLAPPRVPVTAAALPGSDAEPVAPELAPVVTAAGELAWLFPPGERLEWAAVEVGIVPSDPGTDARGAALFARHCAACHGPLGSGDGTLAAELPRRPRDLARGAIRTRSTRGVVTAAELFRTITSGAAEYGMPGFAKLPAADRWALVAHVATLRRGRVRWGTQDPEPLPVRPEAIDPEHASRVYEASCAVCHGRSGDGRGPLAVGAGLLDETGAPAPPTAFALGPAAFRAGSSVEAIVRTIVLGRNGTRMVPLPLGATDIWAAATHVTRLARGGLERRRRAWNSFFERRRAASALERGETQPPIERWDEPAPELQSSREPGCISCHEGISPIATGRMALAIDAVSGGDPNAACTICHEGRPDARARASAHEGLIGNPGSLWVTSLGLGCGKCHSNRDALTSLQGLPLPEATGGRWLAVVSRRTDPTGASGGNHAYRIQRALMAQETGKVYLDTLEAGLVAPGAPRFTDFAVDDPDGAVPAAGSDAYRALIARALETGHVTRLERGGALPTFEQAAALGSSTAVGAYMDYFRKECARCHLWGEGRDSRGERRSSGCSACHVLNDLDAITEEADRTIPRDRPNHPLRHELVLGIPESQCNHCHTRGMITLHTEPHDRAGIDCGDCHTSIDVHGDGNLYPSIRHQLEIRCEDCHGSASRAPWDLPLGLGTKAASDRARGVHVVGETEHLLTDRGNVRANWVREKGRVVVTSLATGQRHVAPLLQDRPPLAAIGSDTKAAVAAHAQSKHEGLACSACHSGEAQRCTLCHLTYSRAGGVESQDYVLSASNYDPKTTRQRVALTPGKGFERDSKRGLSLFQWGAPEMRPDERGRKRPQVRGCDVRFTYVSETGERVDFRPRMNPRSKEYPPPVAPTLSHEKSLTARPCSACHEGGKTTLPGDEER